jgi:hypothetical protein
VHYRTLDVPERFDCHVALLLTYYFSATDGTVNIGVQDRRFLIGGVEGQGFARLFEDGVAAEPAGAGSAKAITTV